MAKLSKKEPKLRLLGPTFAETGDEIKCQNENRTLEPISKGKRERASTEGGSNCFSHMNWFWICLS
jgi:hypothetical protein